MAAAPAVRVLPFNPSGYGIYNHDAPWHALRAEATQAVQTKFPDGTTAKAWTDAWIVYIKSRYSYDKIDLRHYWKDWWLEADAYMAYCLRNGPVVAEVDLTYLAKEAMYRGKFDYWGNSNTIHHLLRQLGLEQVARLGRYAEAQLGEHAISARGIYKRDFPEQLDLIAATYRDIRAYLASYVSVDRSNLAAALDQRGIPRAVLDTYLTPYLDMPALPAAHTKVQVATDLRLLAQHLDSLLPEQVVCQLKRLLQQAERDVKRQRV